MAPLVLGGTPEGEKKYWVTRLIFGGYKHFLQILVWLKGEHNWIYYWWAIPIAKSNMKTSLSESKYHRLISDNVRCLVHTLFWSLLTAVGQKVDELLQKWSEKLAELCAKLRAPNCLFVTWNSRFATSNWRSQVWTRDLWLGEFKIATPKFES